MNRNPATHGYRRTATLFSDGSISRTITPITDTVTMTRDPAPYGYRRIGRKSSDGSFSVTMTPIKGVDVKDYELIETNDQNRVGVWSVHYDGRRTRLSNFTFSLIGTSFDDAGRIGRHYHVHVCVNHRSFRLIVPRAVVDAPDRFLAAVRNRIARAEPEITPGVDIWFKVPPGAQPSVLQLALHNLRADPLDA